MRHTITVTVEVESDCENAKQVADALLGHITDAQDAHHVNSVVEPGGSEWVDLDVIYSVAKAEACGIKVEAGWAVAP